MNELLAAAKAVIEVWDAGRGVWDQINALRAAVERAEKHEGAGFDKYWRKEKYRWDKNLQRDVQAVWIAAQQAERERIKSKFELSAQKIWPVGFPLNTGYVTSFESSLKAFLLDLLEDNQDDVR